MDKTNYVIRGPTSFVSLKTILEMHLIGMQNANQIENYFYDFHISYMNLQFVKEFKGISITCFHHQ